MIIWLNGAFAAGKTTLAEELHRRLPEALPFDPEYVGYILIKWAPPASTGDFQDIPLWRKLVAEFAAGLAQDYGQTVIVPMTLVNQAYREEIFELIEKSGSSILHVFLDVPSAELHRRIEEQVIHAEDADADTNAREFRRSNVERCVEARQHLASDTLVLRGDQHTPDELATLVLDAASQLSTDA